MARSTSEMELLYLDNAATCHPKMPGVAQAMLRGLETAGNPGRSGHSLSMAGARIVFEAREKLAAFLGVAEPRRLLFTKNCTEAINLVLHGLSIEKRHLVTTSMEHHAVSRTVRQLADAGAARLTVVAGDADGFVTPADLAQACGQDTALVVVCHGSNVSGNVQDLAAIRRAIGPVPLLVDAAQTVGAWPLDVDGLGIDYLAFSGHKALGGPMGVGGLCLGRNAPTPLPLLHGGTGSRSEEDLLPDFLPDRLEAGTPNLPGIAGLSAAVEGAAAVPMAQRVERDRRISADFLSALHGLAGLTLFGPRSPDRRVPTFSLVLDGQDPGTVALRLEREFGILVRSGLHCAPWAHKTLGTFPAGSVRVSFGPTTPAGAIDRIADALLRIARRR